MYKKIIGVVVFCWMACLTVKAQTPKQEVDLMPLPANVQMAEGKFRLQTDFRLALHGTFDKRLFGASSRFLSRLRDKTGLFLPQDFVGLDDIGKETNLNIYVKREGKVVLGEDESYTLKVEKDGITIEAATDLGALRGLQTLIQLAEADSEGYYFPALTIKDKPRFPWRGIMIDGSRHFMPIEVIKRNLDGMAAVKMNVMHWHLTDDHGLRVESKVYPQIQERASDGMYYTQEQVKEIITYAAERGIRVVPEFDVPGHATAWCVAFPELASSPWQYMKDQEGGKSEKKLGESPLALGDAPRLPPMYKIERHAGIWDATLDPTNEKTYEVLGNFLKEMMTLFPDEYVHIGGDENEGKQWDANPKIQKFMKKHKLKDNHMLQNHFNERLLKVIQDGGKRMMGWDEILVEGLPKDAVIQSWRGHESLVSAAKDGYQVLLSNGYYIDLMHPAADYYLVDPVPAEVGLSEEEAKNVLGGEATMWSELVTPVTIDSRMWPRSAVIAERLWSPREVNDVDDMYRRLDIISLELERVGLTHLTYREKLMRNITGGRDIGPVEVLVNASVPFRFYNRNSQGMMYTTYGSPYTLLADLCGADAVDALHFNNLVDTYVATNDREVKKEMQDQLNVWIANDQKIKNLIKVSPILKDAEQASANLAKVSSITLEVLSMEGTPDHKWYESKLKELEAAHHDGPFTEKFSSPEDVETKVGSRTSLLAVEGMIKLLKYKADKIDG
ncbi:family 20 glycosylhydrolase [Limibacter armeniacum]|uniref:beta-N-acetylhexosaminidase n=1 Tax=Limibacter armeniacum TaxID=466084 RepID=UPI002FE654E1